MHGLRVISPSILRASWWRSAGAVRRSHAAKYLRGLSAARVVVVLLICAGLTLRQTSICVFAAKCSLPNGPLATFADFLARQFLFALPMLFAVTIADNLTARSRALVKMAALAAAVLFGAIVYAPAFFFTQPPNVVAAAGDRYWVNILAHFSRAVVLGGLATAVLYLFAREREDARAMHEAQLEKLSLDRQSIEAHLQALQAQIEPHFLFNTLANVKLLFETDSARAKVLLGDLAAYLRTALPQFRAVQSTLGRELELAEAYLRVLNVRMGERLGVAIDVPAEMRSAALPSMMLLTLVENAIKHGLGSLPQGGTVTIRAERSGERLHVSVIDDGIGFPKGFGVGVGLANTRARLTALYGEGGHLVLAPNPRGGVIARIELPFDALAVQSAVV
jgi:sensor histidine kinase YesM